jgi:hypothetical protein
MSCREEKMIWLIDDSIAIWAFSWRSLVGSQYNTEKQAKKLIHLVFGCETNRLRFSWNIYHLFIANVQRTDRWKWNPEVLTTWDSCWFTACATSNSHQEVSGKQWDNNVVSNLHVGRHLSEVIAFFSLPLLYKLPRVPLRQFVIITYFAL